MTASARTDRRQVLYSGTVQGVGFRYTASRIAARYDVAGFVRNVPDGRVQIVVEGESEELDRFLTSVHAAMDGYITDKEVTTAPATGEFHRFDVRF